MKCLNAEELVKKVILENWDVVICDLNMPGNGIDALKQIRQTFPKTARPGHWYVSQKPISIHLAELCAVRLHSMIYQAIELCKGEGELLLLHFEKNDHQNSDSEHFTAV